MKIIKRNGKTETFQKQKIVNAILKAMNSPSGVYIKGQAEKIANNIEQDAIRAYEKRPQNIPTVQQIETAVFYQLAAEQNTATAKAYEAYRSIHEYKRQENTSDENILALIGGTNEDLRDENSNKNSAVLSTQRDLIAGEVSKDIAYRKLLPEDLVEADKNCAIHIHDLDYIMQGGMSNCCLINLKDMLDNGTVINKCMVETPKSFHTACTITTQIIAQVASSQYGGQAINGIDRILAPYVRKSFERNLEFLVNDSDVDHKYGVPYKECEKLAWDLTKREIRDGVQTIQYQLNTLQTTNGQSPFVTLALHFEPDYEYAKEAAMVCKEILKQRIQGVKNEQGVVITPVFPKLIYVLDEHNIHEDSPYYYLTKLAAECTTKRMYPDYVSAKKMRETHDGQVYSPMGCYVGDAIVTYQTENETRNESLERAWNNLKYKYQAIKNEDGEEILCADEKISSQGKLVPMSRIIRKKAHDWLRFTFSGGRTATVTLDHIFRLTDGRDVLAKDMTVGDKVDFAPATVDLPSRSIDTYLAWLIGVMVCDGSYRNHVFVSLGQDKEDIIERTSKLLSDFFNYPVKIIDKSKYGMKYNYKEVSLDKGPSNKADEAVTFFSSIFGGVKKTDRQLPADFLLWPREARMSLLAGIVDADGYISKSSGCVEIGSTNKALAHQEMVLAESLGFDTSVYLNRYDSKDKNKIRYQVSFIPNEDLVNAMASQKKINNVGEYREKCAEKGVITKIEPLQFDAWAYDVTTENELFDVDGIVSHNCRSFLTLWKDENGEYKFDGRFNMGVVSLNLPQIAIIAKGDQKKFDELLQKRLLLVKKALLFRYNAMMGNTSDIAPILWQNGAYARLKPGEKIDKYLQNGYSTLSIGYIGLYEACYLMLGESNTTPKGYKWALETLQKLRDAADKWKSETGLGFSLYGSPSESLCYKFCKKDKELFGEIKNVTDKGWYTNSYHVDVREPIDWDKKWELEAPFQKISSGGNISYVEVPDMKPNPEAVLSMMKFLYDHIQYAEFNTKLDYCHKCGYDGEMKVNKDGEWECPKCGNTDRNYLTVTRRVCGYLGSNFFNKGKTAEISQRVMHI